MGMCHGEAVYFGNFLFSNLVFLVFQLPSISGVRGTGYGRDHWDIPKHGAWVFDR
ncbi:hypothetical protein BU24DRAFT_420544 [Aaosphaeria arxii CBS 175.79]|uniref:Uncharacterized protein n=1 Tax=Aaosphaeria arxii CBS 175.79 TaxID=1450172 RepID=A0A6A5XZ04_9PLEO|nr:uncharacterized protein BU24DRAFT_420544 [Aaosphaeria arxii CBS 175.79]KAF2017514.1 hypothetical protein BU24DRAFT_420544 [Aaosphaeria arxii CBS 175.79]